MSLLLQQGISFENDPCPSSPNSRKKTSINEDNYSTPKSKYKSVEKHAHELIQTPKPSSKKKSMFTYFDQNSETQEISELVLEHPLPIHKQLSTIQENNEDDKENNQNYYNQCFQNQGDTCYDFKQLINYNNNDQKQGIKRLNLLDQIISCQEPLTSSSSNQIPQQNFKIDLYSLFPMNHPKPVDPFHSLKNNNRLIEFFQMFNEQNDEIKSKFIPGAQFEIVNNGFTSNVVENIIYLIQNIKYFQVDSTSVQVENSENAYIINLRGCANVKDSSQQMNMIASAKLDKINLLISHLKIQFQ